VLDKLVEVVARYMRDLDFARQVNTNPRVALEGYHLTDEETAALAEMAQQSAFVRLPGTTTWWH
jgi:hypothetical protein